MKNEQETIRQCNIRLLGVKPEMAADVVRRQMEDGIRMCEPESEGDE
jgi:hypothetical protein